jgi:hypothetical protein
MQAGAVASSDPDLPPPADERTAGHGGILSGLAVLAFKLRDLLVE